MKKLICKLLGHDFWACMWHKDDEGWMSARYVECRRCGKRVRLDG